MNLTVEFVIVCRREQMEVEIKELNPLLIKKDKKIATV